VFAKRMHRMKTSKVPFLIDMKKLLFIVGLLCFSVAAQAQLETGADFRRQVYDHERSFGIMFHSRGYAANFRRLYYKDGFVKLGYELELGNLRHPSEVKVPNLGMAARGWVFNKINSLYTLRAGYGREKIFVDKTDRGSLSISWVTFSGLSLGILKPIYLEVPVEGSNFFTNERYDPAIHSVGIQGQSPFFVGIEHSQIRPGLYFKNGFSFDYDFLDEKVTALEVGVMFDYFPSWFGTYESSVPIMYEHRNLNFFFQFYLTFNFGKKWN
jgi:hypothetical protein